MLTVENINSKEAKERNRMGARGTNKRKVYFKVLSRLVE